MIAPLLKVLGWLSLAGAGLLIVYLPALWLTYLASGVVSWAVLVGLGEALDRLKRISQQLERQSGTPARSRDLSPLFAHSSRPKPRKDDPTDLTPRSPFDR